MSEPTLTLFATSLCSKWGFSDGDVVRDFLNDLVDAELLEDESYNSFRSPYQIEKHKILRRLVHEYLMPAIPLNIDVEIYDIETSHNPIRARKINGYSVDHYAIDQVAEDLLKPYSVEIPWRDVVRISGLEVVTGEVVPKSITTKE